MTKICIFPGQGAQKKGMGRDLFEKFPEIVSEAQGILGYSIKDLCSDDPESRLANTEFTQPALFTVNFLSYLELKEEKNFIPEYTAGHSLGEYNALAAAGVFDFSTGLKLVKRRGELMSMEKNGAMTAVIDTDPETIRHILDRNGLDTVDIANLNSQKQTVISGISGDVSKAESVLSQAGVNRTIRLNVSGAFHSRYMSVARENFAEFLDNFSFNVPEIPVVSNVTARPYEPVKIRENLLDQISNTVRWTESVQWLLGKPEPEFIEAGPGRTLTRLIKQIGKD